MDSNLPPETITKALSETPSPTAAARADSEFLVTPRGSLIIALVIDSEWSGWSSGTQRLSRGPL